MATQLANMARRMKISKGLRTGSRAERADKQRERGDGAGSEPGGKDISTPPAPAQPCGWGC